MTASLLFNNWPTIKDLVYGNGNDLGGWLLDLDFVSPDGDDILSDKNQAFFGSVLWSVVSKANKGVYVVSTFYSNSSTLTSLTPVTLASLTRGHA